MVTSVHLVQRGPHRLLAEIHDRLAYLDLLITFAAHFDCLVHAYALMANHVHLLLTGRDHESVLELDAALRPAFEADQSELRPIHARRYLLGCMRYVDLNPVRAHMVRRPEDYRWSSYRANALGWNDPAVTPHALYCALGRSPEERQRAYARFVQSNHFGARASP